jgi:formylglycine-generating enzyme
MSAVDRCLWMGCILAVTACDANSGNDSEHLGDGPADAMSDGGAIVGIASSVDGDRTDASGGTEVSTTDASGAIGTAGTACNTPSALLCAGHAQQLVLLCEPTTHVWTVFKLCGGKQRCDSSPGPNQGSCQDVTTGCEEKMPGDKFCSGTQSAMCGPDLVTAATETCPHACTGEGICGGVCDPGTKQCFENGVQTCQVDGTWAAPVPCPYGACVGQGVCSVLPGCALGPTTCGPNGNGDCCAANLVPGGTYNRSNDASYPATVSSFRLDNYEITVGRFRKFVAGYPGNLPVAGAGKNPNDARDSGWDASWNAQMPADATALRSAVGCDPRRTWTDIAGSNESLPMTCITWHEAYAFCIWDGGRLPTEAEWNYAAAGGSEQREYPWSNPPSDLTIDSSYAVYGRASDTQKVGSRSPKGDGKWGQSDLAGDVWEWVTDWNATPYSKPCVNCSNSTIADGRMFRGGGFADDPSGVLASSRDHFALPMDRYIVGGARCARFGTGCEGKMPGDKLCLGTQSVTCGPDLLTTTAETCPHVCTGQGVCSGVCDPGNKQCSGNGVQTCQTDGTWSAAVACPSFSICAGQGVCSALPGCAGVPATCGPDGNRDCCAASLVPGGTYNRSNDSTYPATVSAFHLDDYEITVGRFRQFVTGYPGNLPLAGAGKNPNNAQDPGWDIGWHAEMPSDATALAAGVKCDEGFQNWTELAGGKESHPMNCLTWYEAYAFCIWDRGRLPTEAEWNYAAAGGSEQRKYPWSNPPSDVRIDDTYAVYCGESCFPGTSNVGSRSPKGDGKWGQSDLAGNVEEWVLDWYATPYPNPCTNCSNSTVADNRVLRGSSFNNEALAALTSNRLFNSPTEYSFRYSMGARCARTP